MSDLLKDLKNYILEELFPDFDEEDDENFIFLDSLSDSPDTVIAIAEYTGKDLSVIDERRIQILNRSLLYSSAKSLSNSIRNLFSPAGNPEKTHSIGESADRLVIIKSIQPPFKMDVDERERVIFGCNYVVLANRD